MTNYQYRLKEYTTQTFLSSKVISIMLSYLNFINT